MAKSKMMGPEAITDYNHRIQMARKDGGMQMTHEMPMPKTKKAATAMAQKMIDKMFGSVNK